MRPGGAELFLPAPLQAAGRLTNPLGRGPIPSHIQGTPSGMLRACGVKYRQGTVPNKHSLRLDDVDAMTQHRAVLVGMEHAGHRTELGHRAHADQQPVAVLEQ